MVEEQVEVVLAASDLDGDLAANEGEADTQVDEEVPDVLQKATLQLPLPGVFRQREEVKLIGVLSAPAGPDRIGAAAGFAESW